uniref:hypothetical protein n=1 Tax=Flavobacterium sp. TaxID=239 RepID=UPI00404B4ECB
MRIFLIIIVLGSFFNSFGQSEFENLENAYRKRSQKHLNQFFQKWQEESIPTDNLNSLSELEKDVYTIFKDFYNPFNLGRIGDGEWGNELYAEIDYIIVQNKIFIYTYEIDSLSAINKVNRDTIKFKKDSINDFCPDLNFGQVKTLFLFPKYEKAINKFLGTKNEPLGSGNIMNPAKARGLSEKRQKFLNKKLKIIHGHWGGYWHIITHPFVFSISFNLDRTIAHVNFRLVYQGGEAHYVKQNGQWILEKSKLTWIE